jgi:hypothetical protein
MVGIGEISSSAPQAPFNYVSIVPLGPDLLDTVFFSSPFLCVSVVKT